MNKKYSWYQETHIKVSTSAGVFESRTVNQVTWKYNRSLAKGLQHDPWTITISGGAPFIKLPNDMVLVVSLEGGDKFGMSRTLLDKHLLSKYKKNIRSVRAKPVTHDVIREFLEAKKQYTTIDVPSYVFPTVLGFIDRSDPGTAFIVEPLSPAMRDLGIVDLEIVVSHVDDGHPSIKGLLDALPWLTQKPTIISATTLNGEHIRRSSKVLYGE